MRAAVSAGNSRCANGSAATATSTATAADAAITGRSAPDRTGRTSSGRRAARSPDNARTSPVSAPSESTAVAMVNSATAVK